MKLWILGDIDFVSNSSCSFRGSVIGKQAYGKDGYVDKEFKKLEKGEDRTPKPKSEDSSQVRQEVDQLKHKDNIQRIRLARPW